MEIGELRSELAEARAVANRSVAELDQSAAAAGAVEAEARAEGAGLRHCLRVAEDTARRNAEEAREWELRHNELDLKHATQERAREAAEKRLAAVESEREALALQLKESEAARRAAVEMEGATAEQLSAAGRESREREQETSAKLQRELAEVRAAAALAKQQRDNARAQLERAEAAAAAAKDRALQEDEAQVTELSTRVQQLHDELRVARQAAEGTMESSAVAASAEAAMESWRRRAMEAEANESIAKSKLTQLGSEATTTRLNGEQHLAEVRRDGSAPTLARRFGTRAPEHELMRCGQAEEEAAMWQERAEAAAEEAAATRSELLALGSELGNLQRLHSQEVSALAQPQQLHLAAD
eukprot:COSAG04_NODE_1858_length_5375_cov_13.206406_4_plen_357_part_00